MTLAKPAKGTYVPKAGKSKAYSPPPLPNPEKQAAQDAGQRQFVAKQFPPPLPAVKGTWDAAMDILCRQFRVKRVRPPHSNDVGVRYDPHRKHLVYPPNRREEGS